MTRHRLSVLLTIGIAFGAVLGLSSAVPRRVEAQSQASTVMLSMNATLGPFLTDANGMTLYIFTTDTPNTSNCSGQCAMIWPPFQPPAANLSLPPGVSGMLGVITRADGTQQVTYNGMPLYFFAKDMMPGDTNGQGVLGTWFVVAPSAAAASPAAAQATPAVLVSNDPTLGPILTGPNGMTLYIDANDTPNTSNCSGQCAVIWPPFQPPAGSLSLPAGVSGTLGTITRADGTQQVTYNGMPLYFFAKDMMPGDVNGQGVGPFTVAAPAASSTAAPSQSAPTVLVSNDPTLGPILTDPNGMTLYIDANDTPNTSNCSGQCAVIWPPFQPPSATLNAPAGATGTLGVITRADGTQQVTYNGMPLYYFDKDMMPGDTTGQGVGPFTVAMP